MSFWNENITALYRRWTAKCTFSGMLVRNGGSFEDDLSLGAEGGYGRVIRLLKQEFFYYYYYLSNIQEFEFILKSQYFQSGQSRMVKLSGKQEGRWDICRKPKTNLFIYFFFHQNFISLFLSTCCDLAFLQGRASLERGLHNEGSSCLLLLHVLWCKLQWNSPKYWWKECKQWEKWLFNACALSIWARYGDQTCAPVPLKTVGVACEGFLRAKFSLKCSANSS